MNKAFWSDRLREPSTWRGLIMLLTGLGVGIHPQAIELIIAVGTAAAGAVGVVTPDVQSRAAGGPGPKRPPTR